MDLSETPLNQEGPHMRSIMVSAVALFAFAGIAQADVMSGGALFGSPSQTTAVCYIYNSGNAGINISSFRITGQNGVSLPNTTNECGAFSATLEGGKSCGIASAANNQAFNCKANVSNKANARGVFEMRNGAGASITNVALR